MEKSDDRGAFVGITQGSWHEVNYVTSQAGSVWGNHYHSQALERFFLVKGSVRVEIRHMETGSTQEEVFQTGDIFEIKPKELHIFHVLEETSWINMYDRSDVDFIRHES